MTGAVYALGLEKQHKQVQDISLFSKNVCTVHDRNVN